MVVDVMKLFEEAQKTGKTGMSKKVEEKIKIIKGELVKNGVTEVPVATLRKMVEVLIKSDLPKDMQENFSLDYSTVRGVVKGKFALVDKKCVFGDQ